MPRRYACVLALACLALAPRFSFAAVPTDLSGQPAFVRANPRVLERLDDLVAAARLTPTARPAAPSPCNATDQGTKVTFTWTSVPGVQGYHLFRDGLYYGLQSSSTTSFQESPGAGAHSYCIVAYNADGISDPCCDTGAQTQAPNILLCSMQVDYHRVNFFWAAPAPGLTYTVYRDNQFLTSTTSTAINDIPSIGSHMYCVEASAPGLSPSDRCCQPAITVFPLVGDCTLQNQQTRNIFAWTAATGGLTYTVLRDEQFLTSTTSTSVIDIVPPGPHTYCVFPVIPGITDSRRCCKSTFNGSPPPTPTCTATNGQPYAITFRWTNVATAERYEVTRDNVVVGTFFPPETTLVDSVLGSHQYCVQAFNGETASGKCCATGSTASVTAHWRLSWDTCSPQVVERDFTGPATYSIVLSATQVPLVNVGHDSEIHIRPAVPDAWRFDAGECQTDAGLNAQVVSQKGCPAMLGNNALKIVNYSIDGDGSASLRLATVYDDFNADPATRYTLWRIDFDHSSSIAGHDTDDSTCDGADQFLYFKASMSLILLKSGTALNLTPESGDGAVTWNYAGAVPTSSRTWGRLKGMYR